MDRRDPAARLALAALAMLLSACRAPAGPRPEDVPERLALHAYSIPVLQATIHATASGYTLVKARRAIGTPTLALDPSLDLVVTALDADGNRIASISVPNPRSGHTEDAARPRELVLDEGFLDVRFPDPDSIHALEIRVREGPNRGLRQTFVIDL